MAIHYFTAAIGAAVNPSHRKCPACAHKQSVAASRKDQVVLCSHCGAAIPPQANVTSKGGK